MIVKEIWKPIKNYEGFYEVSNLGRVKSLQRGVPYKRWGDSLKTIQTKILSQKKSTALYEQVVLSKNGAKKDYLTHRLVAETFIPNPENKPEVNHIDGNKKNNSLKNLEWVTRIENKEHARINNLVACCEAHGMSKYPREVINKVYQEYASGKKQNQIARETGISTTHVNRIVNKKTQWI